MDENQGTLYAVRKGQLWLMSYQDSGMTELNAEGKRVKIYTCVWGEHMRDAKIIESGYLAAVLAEQNGGERMVMKA